MKRFLFLLAGLALLAGIGRFDAQQPDAEPEPYAITPQAGNWLICVASYTQRMPGDIEPEMLANMPAGVPDAGRLAHDFAQEIRTKYKTPAYVYNRGAEEHAKQLAELQKLRQLTGEGGRFRTIRIREQFAVLVGGYKDSQTARKELDRIKRDWKCPDKQFCTAGIQIVPDKKWDGHMEKLDKTDTSEKGCIVQTVLYSPFNSAFVVPNPLVPKDQTADNTPEKFMEKINEGEEFNLLKQCKHPWTLTVAVFQSPPTLQGHSGSSSFLDKLTGREPGHSLAASAMNAHNLAEVLRKIGFNEAYVLHTRYNSVVTLGGYDTENDRRMDQMWEWLERQKMPPEVKAMLLSHPLPLKVPKS
jgi:hypothetical protein